MSEVTLVNKNEEPGSTVVSPLDVELIMGGSTDDINQHTDVGSNTSKLELQRLPS